jgi:hypothetical protein
MVSHGIGGLAALFERLGRWEAAAVLHGMLGRVAQRLNGKPRKEGELDCFVVVYAAIALPKRVIACARMSMRI